MAAVDMVTLAEVKTQLELGDAGRDGLITPLITSASRAINRRYGREATPKTEGATRRFEVPIRSRLRVVDFKRYDLRAATTVTLNPQESPVVLPANVGYTLLPVGGNEVTGTYLELQIADDVALETQYSARFGHGLIDVTGNWGAWETGEVAEDVKRACIVTVGSWMDRAVAEYGLDAIEEGRAILPSRGMTWAIPWAAHSLLVGCGFARTTAV